MSAGHIAVGVDGSPNGRRAVDWAVSWASALGVPLLLVAAEPIPPGRSPDTPGLGETARRVLDEELTRVADEQPSLEVSGEVVIAHPVTALVDASKRAGAVVVGTKGTGGWRGTVLGSVSGNVAASARCPTVVIPTEAPAAFDSSNHLVVGFDGSDASVQTARLALQAAADEGRAVRLVQAEAGVTSPEEPLETAVETLRQEHPGVAVDLVTVQGKAAEVLTEHSVDAAFVVVASQGHRGVPGFLLGSTTRALVQTASAPVIVLTHRSEEQLWPVSASR